MLKQRSEVNQNDKWDVRALYDSLEHWRKDLAKVTQNNQQGPIWDKIIEAKGTFCQGAELIKKTLDLLMDQARLISKIYTYAHLRHDEDIANNEYKSAYNQALALIHDFQEAIAWIEPELLALPQEKLDHILTDPVIRNYRFHLEKIVRMKPHTLTPDMEQMLALCGRALQTAHKAFSSLNDADFSFGTVKDSNGEDHTLSHASAHLLGRSKDRTLRKNAYLTLHQKYNDHQNTLAELLNGQVQAHLFNARARKYKSCLEAALYPKNIDLDVYHTLIDTVHKNLSSLHRYNDLRKKVLNLDTLHLYDMTVPLTANFDITMTYDEAEQIVVDSVAPLGEEYQSLLHEGLKKGRWVDRYENKNKRSGAYSSGCYDSHPYILMNYKGLLRDVFTLAHEAGHSMHSLLSHKHQPYQYADYPIFLAEVASTFNEELLTVHMVKTVNDIDEKIFLINQKIEDIRGTLFRQVMFAEFELLIHDAAEKGVPLTPGFLGESYEKLLENYFGPNVVIDPPAIAEWSRIPHFYYNFYVYQYATGISAALALSERVLNGGASEREAYLDFLKSGCSDYPIELLKKAGVDMHTSTPVESAIRTFDNLVGQLDKLISKRQAVSS